MGDPQLRHRHRRGNSQPLVPHHLGSLQDYRFHSTALSRREQQIIRMLAADRPEEAKALASQFGLLNYDGPRLKPNRERREAGAKASVPELQDSVAG